MTTRTPQTVALLVTLLALASPSGARAQETLYVYEVDGTRQVLTTPRPDLAPVELLHAASTHPTAAEAWSPSGRLEELLPLALQYASLTGLDPALVCGVIDVESSWDPQVTSSVGAAGLMQIMPHLWREHALTNPWDPAQNLRAGTAYLADLLARYQGRLDWALAAYNAGPGKVRASSGPPSYTQPYIRKVIRARLRWRARLEHTPLTPSLHAGSGAPTP